MSVVFVVIGVGICTVTDVNVNAKGFICATVAVLSTSLQQIVSIHALYIAPFCLLVCVYLWLCLPIIYLLFFELDSYYNPLFP